MTESAHPTTIEQRFVPRERQNFFDAQRRNRRATWRISALSVASAVAMGIPLALILTPLIYACTLIVADIVNFFSPLPTTFWQQANEVARLGFVTLSWLFEHKPAAPQALAFGAAVMLLPGLVLSVVLCLGMHALFRHGGVGGALLALKAREPDQADLKELRLADVVQEMAIAAGLPAPRVMLVEAPAANAAAIGTSSVDARIVVSRRLVEDLSRDELEGVLAHLIASIGNGDLRVAFRVTAIFETCGFLVVLINSPFGPQSRRMLWRIIRYGLGGSARNGGAQEAAAVADLLTRNVALETADIDRFFDMAAKKSALRSIRNFLFFPIFFTNAAMRLSLWFFSYAVLGPSMALLWRTRQYLADASAVQLTRNPDGLGGALQKLKGGVIPGGGWASHLFIVSPTPAERVTAGTQDAKQKQILAQAWAASAQHTSATAPQPRSGDSSAILSDVAATYRAAFAGDAQATVRIRAFNRVVATFDPAAAARIPDPADLHAARQGDAEAIARLRALRHFGRSHLDTVKGTSQPSDTASISFLGFHPSLKRRLRRLQRMGAHVDLTTAKSKSWIVAFVFSLILAPLFLLLVSLFLLLMAVMTMTSLTFLVVWLAVIHKIFALVAHH